MDLDVKGVKYGGSIPANMAAEWGMRGICSRRRGALRGSRRGYCWAHHVLRWTHAIEMIVRPHLVLL